jgi:N-glycosylase/DNA lyase
MANKPLTITILDDFDLDKIADSGQCFRVRKFENGFFRFVTSNYVLYIKEIERTKFSVSCSIPEWTNVWRPYFDLNRNYETIRQTIPVSDNYMLVAASEGAGIRILRQDPWETLISFIISQRKSIPSIKKSIEMLSEAYGTPLQTKYERVFLFPSPSQLQMADPSDLATCKLGYRVPYVESAVLSIVENKVDLEFLSTYDDHSLFQALKGIKGVGDKVSNCVCLFAYGRTAMVPIDTWILKIINEKYSGNNPFPSYGEYAGIMQQYAFYYALNHKRG